MHKTSAFQKYVNKKQLHNITQCVSSNKFRRSVFLEPNNVGISNNFKLIR